MRCGVASQASKDIILTGTFIFLEPRGCKTFFMLNSTELKVSTARKTKIPTNKELSCLKSRRCLFIMLINVKMPTIIGIITFMSRINFRAQLS